jgi:NAD(P)-dependent dehydrogenase (short-subunit alcohol dehydrogenase family)
MTSTTQPVALITGASQGLGRALLHALDDRGWTVVVDARDAAALTAAAAHRPSVVAVPGDITDPRHRQALAAAVGTLGRLDLVVNNASTLGASPLPRLADHRLGALRLVYETNVVAPVAIVQLALPFLRRSGGVVIDVSSDAAVEAYPGWGGYGSSKAALDQVGAVLAVEEPDVFVYTLDPGDLRTALHQAAFPGEDISDRPEPGTVVPAVLTLLEHRPPSGRYRAADLRAGDGPGADRPAGRATAEVGA